MSLYSYPKEGWKNVIVIPNRILGVRFQWTAQTSESMNLTHSVKDGIVTNINLLEFDMKLVLLLDPVTLFGLMDRLPVESGQT